MKIRCFRITWKCVWKKLQAVAPCLLALACLYGVIACYRRSFFHLVHAATSADYQNCMSRRREYESKVISSSLYVTLTYHGRIGNWMFAYASLLGIAKANGYIPYISTHHPLTDIFYLTKIRDSNAECLQVVHDDLPCTYNPNFMSLPASNVSIDGYIQSWKYFRFLEHEIRLEFKFNKAIKQAAENKFHEYLKEYLTEGRPIIGIHVRRGDVLLPAARKLGFKDAPQSYIYNAIKYMSQKHPLAVFFVCSDDIAWCQEHITPPKISRADRKLDSVPIVFSTSGSSMLDFAMLTFCNHSIITVGTFGWWSAWLAGGSVVYYKDYPLPGTKLDYEMKKEDFFPEDWIGLSGTAGLGLNLINMVSRFSLVLVFIVIRL